MRSAPDDPANACSHRPDRDFGTLRLVLDVLAPISSRWGGDSRLDPPHLAKRLCELPDELSEAG